MLGNDKEWSQGISECGAIVAYLPVHALCVCLVCVQVFNVPLHSSPERHPQHVIVCVCVCVRACM